jgi:hypothetical protein
MLRLRPDPNNHRPRILLIKMANYYNLTDFFCALAIFSAPRNEVTLKYRALSKMEVCDVGQVIPYQYGNGWAGGVCDQPNGQEPIHHVA